MRRESTSSREGRYIIGMIPDSGGWHVGTGGDVPQNCNNWPGRVKLEVGKLWLQLALIFRNIFLSSINLLIYICKWFKSGPKNSKIGPGSPMIKKITYIQTFLFRKTDSFENIKIHWNRTQPFFKNRFGQQWHALLCNPFTINVQSF